MVESRDVTRRLLFDVTGLLHWYAFFPNPSGIQRVTEKLLSSSAVQQDKRVEFVAFWTLALLCLHTLVCPLN